jgi:hypothetical protein
MTNGKTWVACGFGALLFFAGTTAEAQGDPVSGPPAGVLGCTDIGQPRAAILGYANSLRFRSLDHDGGGHRANLTIEDAQGRRVGPVATVQPVDRINEMASLSQGRAGTIVAKVVVDPDFTDPVTNQKGFAPRNLPPGESFIMICEETTGQTSNYTALIIPTDTNEPLRTRPVVFYSISDQLPSARARFQAGSSEVICVSCKARGWCEVQ